MGVELLDPQAELELAARTAGMAVSGTQVSTATALASYVNPYLAAYQAQQEYDPYIEPVAQQIEQGEPYFPEPEVLGASVIPPALVGGGLTAVGEYLAGIIGTSGLPSWAQTLMGAAAGAGIGIAANELLEGGDSMAETALATQVLQVPGVDIPLSGPGLKEPPGSSIVWQKVINVRGPDFATSYNLYRLNWNGKTVMASYSSKNGWRAWRPAKNAVIGKNMPSHKTMTRLVRFMKRQVKDASTVLDIAAPRKLTKNAFRKPVGYKRK